MNLYLWVFLATWQEPRLPALVSRPPFKQNNLVNSQDVIIIRIGSPSSFFKGQMYVCMGAQGAYRDYPSSSNSLVNYHDSASRTIIIGLPSPFKQISIVNYWKIVILKKKPPPSNKKNSRKLDVELVRCFPCSVHQNTFLDVSILCHVSPVVLKQGRICNRGMLAQRV